MLLSRSWGAAEDWGAWMLGDHGEIEFKSHYPKGEKVVVYVELFGAPFVGDDAVISLAIGNKNKAADVPRSNWKKIPKDQPFLLKTDGLVGEDGIVNTHVFVGGEIKLENDLPGARRFSVGIKSFAYAGVVDVVARTDIVEQLMGNITKV
jgi:hypothetical protein